MSEQQQEIEFVSGTIQGINQRATDKWQVEVGTGGQYNRKLWTKDAELVAALTARIGQQENFACGVSHWTNNEGKPVKSLWINAIGVTGSSVPGDPSGHIPRPAGPVEYQKDYSPEAQKRIEEAQHRNYVARSWEITAAVFAPADINVKDTAAIQRYYGELSLFQKLVLGDIVRGVATTPESAPSDDIPF